MGVCAESAETFRKKLSLTKGYYHKISFLSRYKLLKIIVPFLCNVYPILLSEHERFAKCFSPAGQRMVNTALPHKQYPYCKNKE